MQDYRRTFKDGNTRFKRSERFISDLKDREETQTIEQSNQLSSLLVGIIVGTLTFYLARRLKKLRSVLD